MPDTSYKVGVMEFYSPINQEGSWGSRPLAKRTKSIFTLYYYRDSLDGLIEWEIPHLDMVESIGLVFELDQAGKRTLVDYDGVFSLPAQAMDLLERHGVDCAKMRKSLAD